MDSKESYISKMEQDLENPSSFKKMEWIIPNKEDFLKELDDELLSSSPFLQFQDDLQQKIEKAFLKAAFSGKLTPNSIISNENELDKGAILNALLPYCNIETTQSTVLWILKADKRKAILTDFFMRSKSIAELDIQLPNTDDFGHLLRKIVLQSDNCKVEEMNRNQLIVLSSVLESIDTLTIPKPDINEVKNLLDLKSFFDNYHHLTESFVGRENELGKIKTFIKKPNEWSWNTLVIKGVGGVGKSTLLAKTCIEIFEEKLATLILIDFDRPGMNSEDTAWLLDELIKQVGIQFPDKREYLKKISSSDQYIRDNYSSSRGNVLESNEYEKLSRKNLIHVERIIFNTGKPLVIVFDTIEEVFQQKSFEKLQNFISLIYENFISIPLKIIFSGRIQEELDFGQNDYEIIFLDAFDKATAKVFLKKLGNDNKTIESILKTTRIPLRPLELKLISGILKDRNVTFEILEKEIFTSNPSAVSEEFYTGVIYRRVLNRITNSDVRKVAYPGLILRYITPNLLEVLSPILGLAEMDIDQSNTLLSNLESYGWISYRLNDNEIWHRKDLRRIMVRMIMEQQPELVLKIREAAITYFDRQNNEKSKAESLYHKLMIKGEKSDLNYYKLSELKSAAEYIGSDDFDLPKSAAVLLQFARTGKVLTSDIEFLPDVYFKKIYEKTGKRFVNRQQFKEAYKLYLRAKKIGIQLTVGGIGLGDRWEQEMLFNLGEFQEIRQLKSYQKSSLEIPPVLQLLHYIFPAMLLAPEDVDINKVESLLANACDNTKSVEKILSGPESLTIITRLSYAFAVINDLKKLSLSMIKDIQILVKILNKNYKSGHSDRSRLILNILAASDIPEFYQMSLANLKLDSQWLINLQEYTNESIQDLIVPTLKIFNQTTNYPMPARVFLNHIDSMEDIRDGWFKININLRKLDQETVYTIARGTNSTFRNPITAIIYNIIQGGHLNVEHLRLILFDCICTNINDLQPNIFEKMLLRKTDWLNPLIELIDREGSLVNFVSRLSQDIQNEDKIFYVNQAFQRWEKAISLLLKTPNSIKIK